MRVIVKIHINILSHDINIFYFTFPHFIFYNLYQNISIQAGFHVQYYIVIITVEDIWGVSVYLGSVGSGVGGVVGVRRSRRD